MIRSIPDAETESTPRSATREAAGLRRRSLPHVRRRRPGRDDISKGKTPTFSERFIAYMLARNIRIEADLVDHLFNSSEKRLARATSS
jgi:hypothetical protein